MNPKKIKALIFDMDDTLVESERLNIELIFRTFEEVYGVKLTKDDGNYVFGHSWMNIYQTMIDRYALDTDIWAVQNEMLRLKKEWLEENKLKTATGIEKVLQLPLRKVIVSGSGRDEIKMMMENIGAGDQFEAYFATEDYGEGKPSPAGFLMAWEFLKVEKKECLVIEDSKSGLTAASAAEIESVFIREFAETDYSDRADFAFETLGDFAEIFEV